jgi:hypothetical protein
MTNTLFSNPYMNIWNCARSGGLNRDAVDWICKRAEVDEARGLTIPRLKGELGRRCVPRLGWRAGSERLVTMQE